MTFIPRALISFLGLVSIALLGLTAPAGVASAQSTAAVSTPTRPTFATHISATLNSTVAPASEEDPNDFMDLEQDLTQCISSNPLPGCGREPTSPSDRGGWQQFLLFGIMAGGMGFILWRIARSIRARDRLIAGDAPPSPGVPTTSQGVPLKDVST